MVALNQTGWSQKASNWHVYKLADGLAEPACVSVTLSPQGKVTTRHLNLPVLSELDGYSITNIPAPEKGLSRIYESPGGQLWTTVHDGLAEFKDQDWVIHRVPEIAVRARLGPGAFNPIPLCPVRQGVVLFLLPDRLVEFSLETSGQPRTRPLLEANRYMEQFSGMTLGRDGRLWLAGIHGLVKAPTGVRLLKPDLEWQQFPLPEALQAENVQEPHEDVEGGITAVAESSANHQKLVLHFDGQGWTARAAGNEKLRQAWRGPDRTVWAMSLQGLFEWEDDQMNESEEVSARQFFDVATESSGSFWLATSDGLMRCAPSIWSSPAPLRQFKSPVRCLTPDQAGRLWFVSGAALHLLENGQARVFPFPQALAHTLPAAREACALTDGTLLLEAAEQLFRFQPNGGRFSRGARRILRGVRSNSRGP